MDTLYLVPKTGFVIRDPDNGTALPPEGAEKPRTSYWLRRLQDGDVTLGQPLPLEVAPRAVTVKTKPTSSKE